MLDAEFDQFAAEYHEQHAASIRFSGETPDYFAKYKIDDVAAALASTGIKPRRILDFGGGVGNSLGHIRKAFPDSEIVLLDPSSRSLDIAEKRFAGQARFQSFDGKAIPFEDGHFDLVFTACVFHHIPADLHQQLLREINRVLTPGGSFFLFEHNPLNPMTLHAVRNCPFDENAILIPARTMKRRFAEAGLSQPRVVYRIFFPRLLAGLRSLERYFTRIPIGAQYFVHAIKPAV
ncbi:class I SAM-dependent methyltransferase (plasmid) [Phyllobacterium sp. 628]|uniref:class I SAM-dependent methyltransferase n=1 Tax=Phyllobacterium sp. 628 TaxID=2718938 RepID=UPI001662897C|nr:class I SAM-dependent methyltransferase [Phyllobacterium sp. 628]QND55101.1 class I SAM-dependent methyltransferase [Phyllobacterium sp. 628]